MFGFLRSVLVHLVPADIWGSVANQVVFFLHLREFVDLRRWETMNIEMLTQHIKVREIIVLGERAMLYVHMFLKWLLWYVLRWFSLEQLSHCKWLQCPSPKDQGRPHPPKPRLFQKFLLWLMEEVVAKLINVHTLSLALRCSKF